MSLIRCLECNAEISDKATSCPKCACPISNKNKRGAQTIEETSKKLKLQLLLSIFTTSAGIVGIIASGSVKNASIGPAIFSLLTVAGLLWLIVTKFRIWWNHK